MSLRFLDYGKVNPFGEIIGKPHFLAWPVNAYRVTLPTATNGSRTLNSFERVVLKLLEATGPMEAGALADETCIPPDLVKSILLRLRDRRLIDEYGRVVGEGLADGRGEQETPMFATALLFRELATGKVFPFLHLLDGTNPLKRMEIEASPLCKIQGRPAHEKAVPMPRDVIHAWRAMYKRSTAFGGTHRIPVVQQITIARTPEAYVLKCPIAVRKFDGDFRIADPFGNGFSVMLENAFDHVLSQDEECSRRLHQWKQSLSNRRPVPLDDPEQRPREPFENDSNWQRYPKLLEKLRPGKYERFRSISRIHASLEWALFYACSRRPFDEALMKLRLSSQPAHGATLQAAARRVGLKWPERGIRPILEGKLADFKDGRAEMGTVLAIAVLQAEQDGLHPLHRLVSAHPDCIDRILDIKKKRDEKAHGKGKADTREVESVDDSFMREIIHSLLPDIRFADTPAFREADQDVRADALLDARTSMQNEFGFKAFNDLGVNLQNRLIHAERFWLSCQDGDDASSFAEDLYAAVQAAFEKSLAGLLPPDIRDSELISAAEMKAREAGFSGALPKCLSTVKVLAIRQTLLGSGQTLGACAIAFLLMSDAASLRSMAYSQPSFLDDVGGLIVKRGHGNEPLRLQKADIRKIRRASCTIIKTLIGA